MTMQKYKLEELGEFKNGVNFSSDKMGSGYPLVNVKDVTDNCLISDDKLAKVNLDLKPDSEYLAKEGDLFFVRSSVKFEGAGKVGLIRNLKEDTTHCGFIIRYRLTNKNINPLFLLYLFNAPSGRERLRNLASGATIFNISQTSLKTLEIEAPPLPTQRKIASILSAYDDLIENNLKRIKLLEEKAFLRYKKLMDDEKLIEGNIGDLADVKSGFAFKSRDWSDHGLPVIKIKNIGNNDIELNDCSFIPESIAETANKFKLNAGDLLIAMTGATVGKIGMMPKTETSYYLNQRVGIFKPKTENAELFLFCFFNEPSAKNAVESLASGAAQPNISGGQIESIKLYYPKFEAVKEFGDSIKSHFKLIWNLKTHNTKLREVRDILLPRLMSGQIEV